MDLIYFFWSGATASTRRNPAGSISAARRAAISSAFPTARGGIDRLLAIFTLSAAPRKAAAATPQAREPGRRPSARQQRVTIAASLVNQAWRASRCLPRDRLAQPVDRKACLVQAQGGRKVQPRTARNEHAAAAGTRSGSLPAQLIELPLEVRQLTQIGKRLRGGKTVYEAWEVRAIGIQLRRPRGLARA